MNLGFIVKVVVVFVVVVFDYVFQFECVVYYLLLEQLLLLCCVWEVGVFVYVGQMCKLGEFYIIYLVVVVQVLVEFGLDVEVLIVVILYDIIEDILLICEVLVVEFGEVVVELVDGVIKLDKLKFCDCQEVVVESFCKMLLVMLCDLCVIMIKLVDCLYNMCMLGVQSCEVCGCIVCEMLEIYVFIVQCLGMSLVKSELQNLGFKVFYLWCYVIIEKYICSQLVVCCEVMVQVEVQLLQCLVKEGIEYWLISCIKILWSIYNKMCDENKFFDQVMDVFGFCLVVCSVFSCYYVLGLVYVIFKLFDGCFCDFIVIFKVNGYQLLYIVLFGLYGLLIEVQICIEEMDLIVECGVVVYWIYKFGGDLFNSVQSCVYVWIVELIDLQCVVGFLLEFFDNVKVDLFLDEVYLFILKGKILVLLCNFIVFDFVYVVYIDVGNMVVVLCVDKKLVLLCIKLVLGQLVEIIIVCLVMLKLQWLEFVVISKVCIVICYQFKQLEYEDVVQFGYCMFDCVLEVMDLLLEWLLKGCLDVFLVEYCFLCLEVLLVEVVLGNWMLIQVVQVLMVYVELCGGLYLCYYLQEKILINGSECGVVIFVGCCQLIFGDEIMGYYIVGKGIVVYCMDCLNLVELCKLFECWVLIGWDIIVFGDYDILLVVEVENGIGVLVQLVVVIVQSYFNIECVDYLDCDFNVVVLVFNIQVCDCNYLVEVMCCLCCLLVV